MRHLLNGSARHDQDSVARESSILEPKRDPAPGRAGVTIAGVNGRVIMLLGLVARLPPLCVTVRAFRGGQRCYRGAALAKPALRAAPGND